MDGGSRELDATIRNWFAVDAREYPQLRCYLETQAIWGPAAWNDLVGPFSGLGVRMAGWFKQRSRRAYFEAALPDSYSIYEPLTNESYNRRMVGVRQAETWFQRFKQRSAAAGSWLRQKSAAYKGATPENLWLWSLFDWIGDHGTLPSNSITEQAWADRYNDLQSSIIAQCGSSPHPKIRPVSCDCARLVWVDDVLSASVFFIDWIIAKSTAIDVEKNTAVRARTNQSIFAIQACH